MVQFSFPEEKLWVAQDKLKSPEIPKMEEVAENKNVSISSPRGSDHKPKFNPTGLPLTLMLVLTLIAGASAKPMICQNGAPPMLLSLPNKLPCATEVPLVYKAKFAVATIFQPNVGLHETKAYHCRKVHEKVAYWTSVENEDIQKSTFTEKEVGLEECKRMISKKECELGKMSENEGFFSTNLKAKFEFGWPLVRSFYNRYAEIENCLVSPTTIFTKNANKSMSSSVGDLSECDFDRGYCNLPDKSILVWNKAGFSGCAFNFFRTWDGFVSDNLAWVKKDGEFALTFRNPKTIVDCGEKLVISDQGYGIPEKQFENLKVAKREKRESDVGVVTSQQLSGQLTAAMEAMHRMVTERLAHDHSNDCSSVQAIWAGFRATAEKNPTQALRGLLQREDIQARTVAPGLFEIFPCTFLKDEDWEIRDSKECVKEQPLWLKITGKKREAFLDTHNFIVTEKASPVNCDLVTSRFLRLKGKVLKVDRISGKITEVDVHDWSPASSQGKKTVGIPDELQIFKNLAMTKLDELLPINSIEVLINDAHMEAAIQNHLKKTPMGEHIYDENGYSNVVNQGWFDSMWSFNISWFKALTIISNAYVLFMITKKVLIPFLLKHFLSESSVRLLRGALGPSVPDLNRNSLNVSENVEHHDLEAQWPPKIVASLSSVSDSLPTCFGAIEGKPCLFMLDSGSCISLCSLKKATEVGINFEELSKKGVMTVMGEEVPIIGKQKVLIKLGTKTVETEIFITAAQLSTRYEILLGVSTLKKFSKIVFDFENETLEIEKGIIKFLDDTTLKRDKMIYSRKEKTQFFLKQK